mmetsp:Transcript_26219/g.43427  ORF Transcript_26219/g.43427 Transcript_26219/m.43427 type:complete len:311 (-) Transcript_26219:250-1182(-)|eukprot:CAMPEP_0119305536 /NCGR_PEP_ID=MMETSP1333-20130426/6513_1 /TAXON_ID=418940 /ORGANISM="Scyphosphaera apsteinii, Strain RCC1455" /LENGTH=310 /DNA_ID=CAMNT_0007308653 /DNA_START=91 /DNA_END=1023 /DNA_ORIENTATION=-
MLYINAASALSIFSLLVTFSTAAGCGVAKASLLSSPARRVAPSLPPDRPVTWSNPLGTTLTELADNIWLAERPFYPRLPGLQGVDVGCKMAVVRLPDGGLWVHAPVQLDDQLETQLAELGPIKHIVTPNTEHQKFAPSWVLAFPDAVSYACPGLRERKPGVWTRSLSELLDEPSGVTSMQPPTEWGGVLSICWLRDRVPLTSTPFFNEVVFCHLPSKTLIVSDLWWNYPDKAVDVEYRPGFATDVPFGSRLWKQGMDRVYRPVYNRFMRAPGWDDAWSVISAWPFDALAPAHGEPLPTGGKAVLTQHLAL